MSEQQPLEGASQEREILEVMRKVLAQIVVDTTPPDKALKSPLTDRTLRNIKRAFALIADREYQLGQLANEKATRPHFTDEPQAQVVSIDSLTQNRENK